MTDEEILKEIQSRVTIGRVLIQPAGTYYPEHLELVATRNGREFYGAVTPFPDWLRQHPADKQALDHIAVYAEALEKRLREALRN